MNNHSSRKNLSVGFAVIIQVVNHCCGRGKPSDGVIMILKDLRRDGFAVDWPIRYKDVEPWYAYVEKFIGIAGIKTA